MKSVAKGIGIGVGLLIAFVIIVGIGVALVSSGSKDHDNGKNNSPGISKGLGSADATKDVKTGDVQNEGMGTVTIVVKVTNHSSKRSDYAISANLYNADGTQIGTADAYINNVDPKSSASDQMFGTVSDNQIVSSYKVTQIERTASY